MLVKLLFAHLVGDYVLQSNYIAETKSSYIYHLFVHCVLYCLPFYVMKLAGFEVLYIFLTHIVVDFLKTRKKIGYAMDQSLHYCSLIVLWVSWMI